MIRAISSAAQGSGISVASALTGSLGTPLTRGGLVAATLTANVSGQDVKIPCHFNPSEIAISKTIEYTPHPQVGRNIPNLEFKQGDSRTVALTLWFDSMTTLSKENIRKTTDKLWKFALVDPATEDASTKVGTPPIVTFTWEQLTFKGVVTSMTHTYVLFSELGAPLRAKVALTIKQNTDETIPEIQTSTAASALRAVSLGSAALSGMLGAVMALTAAAVSAASSSTNSSSSKSASKKPAASSSAGVMAQEGTRIDHVAAATTGDSANQRQVAENNNIDNPMKLPKGQVIR
jgi:hypothetical protein